MDKELDAYHRGPFLGELLPLTLHEMPVPHKFWLVFGQKSSIVPGTILVVLNIGLAPSCFPPFEPTEIKTEEKTTRLMPPKQKQKSNKISSTSFDSFFQLFASSGAFFEFLKYLRIEEFLLFASVSSSVSKQLKLLIKKNRTAFDCWRKLDRPELEDNDCSSLTFAPISRLAGYEEICDEAPSNIEAWTKLKYLLPLRFKECHLSAIVARGNCSIPKYKHKPLVTRAIYLHPDGDRFVISQTTTEESTWESSERGWKQKIDYIDANGRILITLGTYGDHPFVNTSHFGYNSTEFQFLMTKGLSKAMAAQNYLKTMMIRKVLPSSI